MAGKIILAGGKIDLQIYRKITFAGRKINFASGKIDLAGRK